jgi:hypothetical protein
MSIKWLGKAENRIVSWRNFRNEMDELPFNQAIKEITRVWKEAPHIVKETFEYTDVTNWPGAWDLLSREYYCPLGQLLGIYYTVQYSNHKRSDIVIERCITTIGDTQYRINMGNQIYIDLDAAKIIHNRPAKDITLQEVITNFIRE